MPSWDIRPQGVQGQLQLTGTKAGELEKALKTLGTDVSQAAQAAGTAVPGSQAETRLQGPVAPGQAPLSQKAMGPVAAALAEYFKEREKDLKAMAERIQAAVTGAALATREYVEGDLDTAKQAQDAARAVDLDLLKDLGGRK
ncbi:DUF6507 family protein [Streptomyces sp. GC420]|uniref:DUF6507 family protein n=1 Tax=Streptomyces sp. GC420 TaxID=2697568 RepID=UPI001414D206|nr:DUF6507 family protein [Streptomyces sp. GC420]NBM18477.1 hypothetical protein [Streptomyces sp. GC420]